VCVCERERERERVKERDRERERERESDRPRFMLAYYYEARCRQDTYRIRVDTRCRVGIVMTKRLQQVQGTRTHA
jgi:hypothetical protein